MTSTFSDLSALAIIYGGLALVLEEFFNSKKVIDLSFFNFENAITAAYFADKDFNILRVNKNFRNFFPALGNLQGVQFPEVLKALDVPDKVLQQFMKTIEEKGRVLLPRLEIEQNGEFKVYSLLSTTTNSPDFSFLRGIQGQFVDRTNEDNLRKEKENLIQEQLRNQGLIKQKSERLEEISKRLASYLSPQVYNSIFEESGESTKKHKRKNLTVFFSDIVRFTDMSDTLEPELLAKLVNNYLSEMTNIAIEFGGTIDKFIGDAVMVFFGDPESDGDRQDALNCAKMALRMQQRVLDLQDYWKSLGISEEIQVRMGISTGYCTVGDFGSQQRLDYTAFGSPVNLAARLESLALPGEIVVSEQTCELISGDIDCTPYQTVTPKGFSRPINTYTISQDGSVDAAKHPSKYKKLGNRVSIDIFDTSDINAAIMELKEIEQEFERLLKKTENVSSE